MSFKWTAYHPKKFQITDKSQKVFEVIVLSRKDHGAELTFFFQKKRSYLKQNVLISYFYLKRGFIIS